MIKKNSINYKPTQVCQYLNISRETLRYWRKHLYPPEKTKFFSSFDLFVFQFIKFCVHNKRIKVRELVGINWAATLDRFTTLSQEQSYLYVAVFNTTKLDFNFTNNFILKEVSGYDQIFFHMKHVFKRYESCLSI